MSHFVVAVVLPERTSMYTPAAVGRTVEELMMPYYEGGEWFADGSRWDWYVIGGRWDGYIRGLEWSPKLESCFTCGGTGVRPDLEAIVAEHGEGWLERTKGCNGCMGSGKTEVWPSDKHYSSLERNMVEMREVSPDYTPTAFVRPTGEWIEEARIGFWGVKIPDEQGVTPEQKVAGFDQAWAEARKIYRKHLVVSTDCHV
jgi:hypothetical protein